MAGTLTISTLSDGTNSTSATNCIQGSAKAWIRYNGTAGTITSAYNVGSVTKNSAGNYTLNFTTALPNANYCVTTAMAQSTVASIYCPKVLSSTSEGLPATQTTTQLQISISASGSSFDAQSIYVAVFGS